MYVTMKFIHVIAVAVWFGAAVTINIMMGRLASKNDHAGQAVVAQQATWFSHGVFDPAAIITLIAGVWMVLIDSSLSFGDVWITIGFTGIILTLGIGHGMITPAVKKLGAVIEAEGPATPAAEPLRKRIGMLSMLDVLILAVTIWAMVAKPGT